MGSAAVKMSCSWLLTAPFSVLPHLEIHRALLPPCCFAARWLSTCKVSRSLLHCYKLLRLPEDGSSSPEEVKEAYLQLAKELHPDSGSARADAGKFSQVEEACRTVLAHLAERRRREEEGRRRAAAGEEEEDEKLRRQAPQHRQYLSFEGVGMGTPSQRERQYRQFRVDRAMDQVLDYRRRSLERQSSEDALTASELRRTKNIKITQAIERLVEDLIQESMVKGDFSNLSGKGKPLSKFSHSNPYVDPMTHNLNRILIENGYQPQWIVAHKEIRETIAQLRADLLGFRGKLGEPLTPSKQKQWLLNCEAFRADLARLNKRVDGFNLIVPLLSQQMVHFSAERELKRALHAYQELREERRNSEEKAETGEAGNPKGGLFMWVQNLFK